MHPFVVCHVMSNIGKYSNRQVSGVFKRTGDMKQIKNKPSIVILQNNNNNNCFTTIIHYIILAMDITASVIWNSLLKHLHLSSISKGKFWHGSKTHLFQQSYNLWEPCVEECIKLNWNKLDGWWTDGRSTRVSLHSQLITEDFVRAKFYCPHTLADGN